MKKSQKLSIIFLVIIIIQATIMLAQNTETTPTIDATENEEQTKTRHEILQTQLQTANQSLQEIREANIPNQRYTDILRSTTQLLNAQIALDEAGGEADYDVVSNRIDELKEIEKLSYRTHDELMALEDTIAQSIIDTQDQLIQNHLKVSRNEYETERFELALEEIDKAYVRISELEALDTKLRAAYEATTRNIKHFLYKIRFHILIATIIIILIIIFGSNEYRKHKIRKQIIDLEFRKHVINDLIAKAQKSYFEENAISESVYHIRTKKYAEIIRDINRQRPLLEEKLALLNKKTTFKKLIRGRKNEKNKSR